MAKILDIKIDNLNLGAAMTKIEHFLAGKKLCQIVTVNPEFIVFAQKDLEFKKILNQADLSIPDGFGLQIAASILRQKIGERLTGVDLTWEIAKLAAERGSRIFLLGGKPGIARKTAQRLKFIYPKLRIVGTYAGSPTERGLVEKINASKAEILLVAFGAPKQDKFIFKSRRQLKVKIAMGVGGTFDYIAGNVPRAPKWLRSLGLEWLYRLFIQPRRLGRIFRAVIVFPILVIWRRLTD